MNLIKVVDQMATKEKSFEESLIELETIVRNINYDLQFTTTQPAP